MAVFMFIELFSIKFNNEFDMFFKSQPKGYSNVEMKSV